MVVATIAIFQEAEWPLGRRAVIGVVLLVVILILAGAGKEEQRGALGPNAAWYGFTRRSGCPVPGSAIIR
jgi:hypothetical protein